MKGHERLEADRAIDALLDAADEEVEREPSPRPPFEAVLARARRLAPDRMPPPVDAARPVDRFVGDEQLRRVLTPFVEAARMEAEIDAAQVMQTARPGLPAPARSGVGRVVAVVGVLAAAAAVLLTLGWPEVRHAILGPGRADDGQAADLVEASDRTYAVEPGSGDRPPSRVRAAGSRPDAVNEPAPAPDERLEDDGELVLEDDGELVLEDDGELVLDDGEPSTASSRLARPETLRALDEKAAARLAAGDYAGAEALYRRIIRQGGRSGLVELAYGDLFTLVHRRGSERAQVRLWKEYLAKFPRGRFADDARAGLCRSAPERSQVSCWERYLDDFPGGAYHHQAARALSSD